MAEFIGGWIRSPQEKLDLHEAKYRYHSMIYFPLIEAGVEVSWPLPDLSRYNQGRTNGCTGFSASIMQSIFNLPDIYDAPWLYHRGQETDNDPNTTPPADNGGYIYAVLDVLRNEGHRPIGGAIDPQKGILSYGWCKTQEEISTALSKGPVVFGLPWYEEFMSPRTVNGEFWIGTRQKWGGVLGGHAICAYAYSDSRNAVRLVNSWGGSYPPVWISIPSIMRLLGQWGECAAPVDIPNAPPAPEPNGHRVVEQFVLQEGGEWWQAVNVEMEQVK